MIVFKRWGHIESKFIICTYFTLSVSKQYDNYTEVLRPSVAKTIQISIVSKLVSTIDSNSASCMSGLQGGAASGVVSSVHKDRCFFDKMIEMLIECLLQCDRQLPKEYADLRDEFLGPRSTLLDTNNRSTKVREMQNDFRN